MNILLLEDNSTDAQLTIYTLKSVFNHCKINHTASVREAMEIVKSDEQFDIALLDMQLPDGNGIDILLKIRELGKDMAVAMLTGSGDEEVAVAALKSGADDYMVKNPGYTSKIPELVGFAIDNHKQLLLRESGIIKVLYIEHNAADIDFTKRYFTRYAPFIHLEYVPTAEDALVRLPEKAEQTGSAIYQTILMDYRLTGMGALEFIKTVRRERKLDIPIIIVTGQGSEEVAVQALKLGANEYLMKRENYLSRLPSLIQSAYQHSELTRKQAALKKSEAQYRLLAENSGDVIFTLDFDLNFTFVSPAVYNLRGFTIEEALTQNIVDTLTPQSLKKVNSLFQELLPKIKNGQPLAVPIVTELQTFRKDKTVIWVEVTTTPFYDENGKPVGVLGVTRDISKRKAAQDELRKLSRAVTESPNSIMITDIDGKIEYANPIFTKLTGYSFSEVIGLNPRILSYGYHPESYYKNLWDTILAGNEWRGEFNNRKKDGSLYWENASISPLTDEDGNITHFVAVKEDITEKKKMIQDLIESKDKAEAANRLKTAFLNNISHEVRTPLNGILGFGELIAQKDLNTEDKQLYLSILRKSSDRLMNTITDYMDISLLTSGNMTVTKTQIYLSEILDSVFVDFKQRCAEKNLKFNLLTKGCDEQIIETDVDLLLKVITHIMDNAVKFTVSGHITFECRVTDYTVEFIVEDSGCGVDKEMQQMVFETFTQENFQITRSHEGSGLGLSISKGIVELLGGKIKLESEKGTGTKVQISLPLNKQLIDSVKSADTQIKAEGLPTILAVEDDEDNRFLLEIMLDDAGLNLILAEDGGIAMEKFSSHPEIDLVLMDLRLPVMDGFAATREIKKVKPSLPIIAVTAFALHGDENEALAAGCDDYFSKPYNRKTLLEKIGKFVKLNPDVK